MSAERLPIRGSRTSDNPEGVVVTRAGAMRIALRDMPRDLMAAGFQASVARGFYGGYWVINYGKSVKSRVLVPA